MYFVYILQSLSSKKFYKGNTGEIEKRLKEHDLGKCTSTKHMLPLQLIHVELCQSRNDARHLEKFFKSGYGREIIQELADNLKKDL